ncbi:hypothetical protein CDAR_448151 [Caerostris darwini]|uniref:Uncharacterized protein n=1 Tax=Caerostris darwini TaxID=1538125 RepID=A0AAV4SBA2_9ARAC|nr:hypothetical protein CDAR_448151 [Caerostris darwini]
MVYEIMQMVAEAKQSCGLRYSTSVLSSDHKAEKGEYEVQERGALGHFRDQPWTCVRDWSGNPTASVGHGAKKGVLPCHRAAKRLPIIRLAAWKKDSCYPLTEPEQTS